MPTTPFPHRTFDRLTRRHQVTVASENGASSPAASADREEVIDPAHVLSSTSPEALLSVLSYERRLLEQLLFRTTELTMLIEAGEHRFVQRALEEVQEVEDELGAAEVLRAAVVENLVPGAPEPSIDEVISRAPEAQRPALAGLAKDLRRLQAGIEEQREAGHIAAGQLSEVAARAQASAGASGYRSDGSAVVGA